jgi:hypothetical protein
VFFGTGVDYEKAAWVFNLTQAGNKADTPENMKIPNVSKMTSSWLEKFVFIKPLKGISKKNNKQDSFLIGAREKVQYNNYIKDYLKDIAVVDPMLSFRIFEQMPRDQLERFYNEPYEFETMTSDKAL